MALRIGAARGIGAPASSGLLAQIERTLGLTAGGLIVIGLALGAWVMGRALGGRAAYLFAYGGLGLLGAAIVIARRVRPVAAERSALARRARVGQTLDVTLKLTATRRVTTFR